MQSGYRLQSSHTRIKALRVLMETMSCDFSSCRLSRVHFCRWYFRNIWICILYIFLTNDEGKVWYDFYFLVFSFSITEFWRGMRQNINLIISNMGWYVFKPYFTFKLWWPFCYVGSKIVVSMIRKYHNHKPQTTPWFREEELLNHHKTPGRQIKQSNQLSLSSPPRWL